VLRAGGDGPLDAKELLIEALASWGSSSQHLSNVSERKIDRANAKAG